MTNPEKFRPKSALIIGWVLIVFFTGLVAQSVFYSSGNEIFITFLVYSILIFGSYLSFLKPYVVIFDEGIKIVNPTREIIASWDRVDEIETKYSMSITVGEDVFYAWAAPAPGRRHSRGLHTSDLLPGSDVPRRLGDSPKSDSGVCAHMAKLRRNKFLNNKISALSIFEVRRNIFTN